MHEIRTTRAICGQHMQADLLLGPVDADAGIGIRAETHRGSHELLRHQDCVHFPYLASALVDLVEVHGGAGGVTDSQKDVSPAPPFNSVARSIENK